MDQKNRTTSESTTINITLAVYSSFNIPLPKSNRKEANTEHTKKSKTIKEHKKAKRSWTKPTQAKKTTRRSKHAITLKPCSSFGYLIACVWFSMLRRVAFPHICAYSRFLFSFCLINRVRTEFGHICFYLRCCCLTIFEEYNFGFQDVWAFALYIMISTEYNSNMLHLVNACASYLLALLGLLLS